MKIDTYIEIPNWMGDEDPNSGFQHYKHRDPRWIKNYTRLLSKDEYLRLSLRERGLLHGIWLAYASSGRKLGASPAQLRRALGSETVRARDVASLNHAGFIHIPASSALAHSDIPASPEESRAEKTNHVDVTPAESSLDIHGYMDELAQRRKTG